MLAVRVSVVVLVVGGELQGAPQLLRVLLQQRPHAGQRQGSAHLWGVRDLLLRLRMRAKGGTTGAARVAKSQADTVAK